MFKINVTNVVSRAFTISLHALQLTKHRIKNHQSLYIAIFDEFKTSMQNA
ncbi:hypothetical protein HMPREF9140_01066 [Prevotella micans F0438]|uniref:Uncharacterized protein n=1 Tax=Prevotella micans F0438 TaxID=883158 RepID=H1Q2C8_9BACT|nr:hypothetical protein HMPREF9140_01066 [Prevotella micans F0438]